MKFEPGKSGKGLAALCAFWDVFLSEELLEELLCWFASAPLRAFEPALDAFDGFRSILGL